VLHDLMEAQNQPTKDTIIEINRDHFPKRYQSDSTLNITAYTCKS